MKKRIIIFIISAFFLISCASTSQEYYVSDYPEYGHVETSINGVHIFHLVTDVIVLVADVIAAIFSSSVEMDHCCCHK